MDTNSKNHIGNDSTHEFYVANGEVYRAPLGSPLDIRGYRMGGRWESSISHFSRYLALFTSQGLVVDNPDLLDGNVESVKLQLKLV